MLATTTCSGEFKINGKQSYGETMVAHKLQACGVHAIGTSLLLLAPLSARLRLALSLDSSLVRCLVAAWFHGQARRLGPTSFVALRLDWVFLCFFVWERAVQGLALCAESGHGLIRSAFVPERVNNMS